MILRALLAFALLWSTAHAVEPGEMLADPALEARAREVSQSLRCVVCQNETIDESHAELAHDMRVLVRERITAGDSNQQVIAYMQNRYGDFVLLKPRFTGATFLLWCGPLLVLIAGIFAVRGRVRTTSTAPAPLTPDEERTVAALTQDPAAKP
jgi:cytochrome c-type biogenesis protein CcmH